MSINLTVVIDNDEAIRKFRELQKTAKTVTSSVVTDADRMDIAMRRIATTLGQIGVAASLTGLVKQIALTRGEFQQLEVAFTTLLQSKEKADVLMSQMVELAAKTPFDLQGVASGARQLLAYGFAAEDITDTLTRLGNVAAGLGLNLQDLTWLYGTTAVQGRLYTRDVMQFQSRGIDLAGELATQLGKTRAEISQMVTEGKIGFPEVQKAIESMTNEGGKFYNLMQEQSKTITGLISNLGDALDMMFNDLGKSQEGVITGVLKGTISLVENYQKVLDILIPLVAAYGMYKAALIATAAIQKVSATITATKAILEQTKMLTRATQAQILFNQAVKANPYALAAGALAGLVTLISRFSDEGYDAAKAQKDLNESVANASAGAITEQRELARLKGELEICTEGTKQYEAAKKKIIEKFGQYDSSLTQESLTVKTLAEKYDSLSSAILKSYNARQYNEFASEQSKLLEDTITKNFDKIYSRLIKELGDEAGTKLYAQIRDSITKGVALPSAVQQTLDKIQDKGTIIADSRIDSQIRAIQSAIKLNDELDEQARKRFGITTATKEPEAETSKKTSTARNKAYWEAQKKEAETALEAMDASLKGTSKWNELVAKIAESDEKIKQYSVSSKTVKATIKAQKKLSDQILANDVAFQQTRIDLMKEGKDKELAEIDLETQQKIQKLKENEQKIKDAQKGVLTEEQKASFKEQRDNIAEENIARRAAVETKYAKEIDEVYKQITDSFLTEEQRKEKAAEDTWKEIRKSIYKAFDSGAIDEDKMNSLLGLSYKGETNAQLSELLKQYETYEQARKRVAEKYAKDAQRLREQGHEEEAKEAERAGEKAVEAVDLEFAQRQDSFQAWVNDITKLSLKELEALLEKTKAKLNAAEADTNTAPSELARLRAEVTRLEKELGEGAQTGITSWEELQQVLSDTIQTFEDVGDALGDTVGEIVSAAGSIAGGALQIASSVKQIKAKGADGIDKAAGYLSAISAGAGILSSIANFFKDTSDYEELIRAARSVNDELRNMAILAEINSEKFDTIFGRNEYGAFVQNIQAAQKALDAYNNSLERVRTREVERGVALRKWTERTNFTTPSASIGAMGSKVESGTTWHHSKWDTLSNLVPYLFDENGEVVMDRLKEFVETNNSVYENMNETDKAYLKEMVDSWNTYQEALNSVNEYLSDIFGDLGGTLTDALVDSFENGTDAAEAFGQAAGDVIKKLAKDVLYSSFLAPIADNIQKQIEEINKNTDLTTEERLNALMGLTDTFINDALAQQDNARTFWEEIEKRAKELGIDISGASGKQQSATTRGFEAMSQDTASELNGRFTDMQGKMNILVSGMDMLRGIKVQEFRQIVNIRDIIIQLNGNVADIRTYARVLPEMNTTLMAMNRKLDDL
jgi:hypothetical protein